MKNRKRREANDAVCVESLESRQLLACAVASPISHAVFDPPMGLQTVVLLQPTTVNGVAVGAGTYSLQQFESIILGTAGTAGALANVMISSDSSQVSPSQPSPTISAKVTDADGNALSAGTVTFYGARPVYDVSGTDRLPCLDEAAKSKVALGSAVVADGEAQFSLSTLPAGEDWVWAEYSSDSITTPVVSTYLPFTSTIATGVHIEQAGTYTATNAPQMAMTLTDNKSAPLFGDAFAKPADVEGSILSGEGTFNFHTPKPALPTFGSASYQGVLTSKVNVYGPTLVRTVNGTQYVAVGTIGTGGTLTIGGGKWGGSTGCIDTATIGGEYGLWGTLKTGGGGGLGGISGVIVGVLSISPPVLQLNGGSVSLSWIKTQTWSHTQYQVPTPTGNVTVSEGDQALSTTPISNLGTALAHPDGLGVGHHQLTFSYAGDSYFAPASGMVEFDITPTPVDVKLKLSTAKAVSGTFYTATIDVSTLSKSMGSLDGKIQLLCDYKPFESIWITKGTKTLSVDVPLGKHNIRAMFVGINGFGTGVSAPVQIQMVANQKPQGTFWVGGKGLIRGVVVDGNQPDAAVACDILIDGTPWTRVVANQQTGAAAAKNVSIGGDNGKHDISVALPQLPAGKHLIQVVAYDADLGQMFQLGDNYWVSIAVIAV